MGNIDMVLYIIAVVLFGLAGFNVKAAVRWEWLAFCVLALSLVI